MFMKYHGKIKIKMIWKSKKYVTLVARLYQICHFGLDEASKNPNRRFFYHLKPQATQISTGLPAARSEQTFNGINKRRIDLTWSSVLTVLMAAGSR